MLCEAEKKKRTSLKNSTSLIIELKTSMRVRTRKQNRVQSSPVGFTKMQHWHRGLRKMVATAVCTDWQIRVESSPVLLSQEPWCRVFYIHLQWSGVTEEMDVEKLVLLVKDHEVIYDASFVNTRTASYIDDDDVHNNKNSSITNNSSNVFIVIRYSI